MQSGSLSQHSVDRLIRELIQTGRPALPGEIADILDRMATAPFDARIASVPAQLRGRSYLGRTLGVRESALRIHLAQRVLADRQWAAGTTESEYLADLRQAVQDPTVQLLVYARRGGSVAATLTDTTRVVAAARRGPDALPWLYVAYSADRGMIASGYQATGLQTLSIPGDARWLK